MSFNPYGALGGGLAGAGLGMLFGGNPASAAQPYLDQTSGDLTKWLGPYASAGINILPQLQNQYSSLVNNPGAFVNAMGANYQASPGYQFNVQQAQGAANRAAAAGGMAGTPMEQQNIANTVSGIANQDYYNYLNNTQNLFGAGLSGQQNIYNTGAQAGNSLAENLAQSLMAQAQLAYAGQANQNEGLGGFLGGLGSLAGSFLKF